MKSQTTNCNPYQLTNDLQQLQKFCQGVFGLPVTDSVNSVSSEQWSPTIDIYETSNELVLQSELPGMTESDFNLSAENNVLTLTGERKFADQSKYKIHRQERSQGSFKRSFTVPSTFDLGKVNAIYKEGILSISIPKRIETKPRQIEIKIK